MKTQRYSVYACLALSVGLSLGQNSHAAGNGPALKKIVIEEHPIDQVVKYGQSVQFKMRAALKSGPGPIRYQWTHNFIPMDGEDKPILSLIKISRSDLGAYACLVSTQHDSEHDQPEVTTTESVSLIGYSLIPDGVLLEGFPVPICEPVEQWDRPMLKKPILKADTSSDDALMYVSSGRSTQWYPKNVASVPLYFISGGTNQVIGYLPPAGGAGPGSGNCPPAYKCYFNFRKSVSPYGWLPAAGATTGKAKHLQSTQTVVKWFVGTSSSGCGSGGEVNITFGSPNNVYRFTVYCPSSTFSTCLTGVQQLEITNFQP